MLFGGLTQTVNLLTTEDLSTSANVAKPKQVKCLLLLSSFHFACHLVHENTRGDEQVVVKMKNLLQT